VVTRVARQTPAGARPNRRREAVLFDEDVAGRPLEGVGDGARREMTVRSFTLRQNPAYRPGDPRALRLIALGWLAGIACAAPVPRQAPTPRAEPVPISAPVVPTRWVISHALVSREYSLDQRALVTVTNDSGTFADSTAISVDLSFRRTTDGGAAGLIQGASLSAAGGSPTPYPGLTFPLAFVASPVRAGILPVPTQRSPVISGPCRAVSDAPLGSVRDLLIRVPDTLVVGTSWSDSGSYQTCRDGIPLTVSASRRFRVSEYRSTPGALVVDRTAQFTLRGFAARSGDTTFVEGTGTGAMRYTIDPASGAILNGDGTGALDLIVRGRTKSERARQTSRVRVVPRTP
jgi:hypothetical protein